MIGRPTEIFSHTRLNSLLSRTGCHYQGVHYENGREWTDAEHPCQVRIVQQRARIHQTLTTSKCSHRLLLYTNENDCIFLLFAPLMNRAPVKVLSCHGGVITIANQSCQTQCNNPLPPGKGQCCPRCPGNNLFPLHAPNIWPKMSQSAPPLSMRPVARFTPDVNHGAPARFGWPTPGD
jgi:hypothetical protein